MTISPALSSQHVLADDLVAASNRLTRQLKVGTGVALAVLMALAAFVPITSGIVQSGQIMAEGRRKVMEHPVGGAVEELRIADGAKVRKGQVLLRLEAGDARLNVQVLEAQALSLRAEQAARQAELMNATEVTFPADLFARQNEPAVAGAMKAQRVAFHARRAMLAGQYAQSEKRLVQLDSGRTGTRAQAAAYQTQIRLLDDEIVGMRQLYARGFASKSRLNTLERAAAEYRGQLAALNAEGSKLVAQKAETRIQSGQARQEAETAAADALRSIQRDLTEVMEKLSSAKRTLSQTLVRAPTSGTVVGLHKTAGEYIQSGEPLLEILPSDDRLVLRAQVLPTHADDVRIGQPAFVRFDAAGGRGTATLEGYVQSMSADALTDPRSGATYFEATIAIPKSEAAKVPSRLLKAGMPAEVLMRAGERTALAYMLAPLTRAVFHMMRDV
jgi:HlyD family type I secretion membrane fusion protein